ncbi:hypothetical protein B0O80DRAFT_501513 [Mortierella sp. GBAus27b]|nr:hypothetical protein B0O80DRAFT_501513 [Mortierella sp. GBAus27b]
MPKRSYEDDDDTESWSSSSRRPAKMSCTVTKPTSLRTGSSPKMTTEQETEGNERGKTEDCTFELCAQGLMTIPKAQWTDEQRSHFSSTHMDTEASVCLDTNGGYTGIIIPFQRIPALNMNYVCSCGELFLSSSSIPAHFDNNCNISELVQKNREELNKLKETSTKHREELQRLEIRIRQLE